VLLSLVRHGDRIDAHLVNDRTHALRGNLSMRIETFEGELLHEWSQDVSVDPNSAAKTATFSAEDVAGREREVYAYARFADDESAESAENTLLFAEPKDLLLPDPGLSIDVADAGGTYSLTVSARRFAGYVWLRRRDDVPVGRGLCEDNYFHLHAGETRTIALEKPGDQPSAVDFQNLLLVRTLYGSG
jgi:beta-mannosidase